MPTVVYDTVRDAEFEATQDYEEYTRTGYIKDIDLSSSSDADALVKCRTILPAFQSALSALRPYLKLVRVRIMPEEAKFRRVRFALTYSTQFTLTPTLYLLRERTFAVQKNTCLIPGTRVPVVVGFIPTGTQSKDLFIASAPVYFDVNTSARSIQVVSLMYGRPADGGAADYVNYVNNAPWPEGDASIGPIGGPRVVHSATALPKGYWRLNSYSTEAHNDGTTLVEAEAVTQVIEDWSQVVLQRNEKTGKYSFASLMVDGSGIAILNVMLAREYARGAIYPLAGDPQQGIARFGPYPLTNFRTLMGF